MNLKNKNKWIAHGTSKENASVNLILFTYAGGSPSLFAPWKKLFSDDVNLCPVLYPARELRKDEPLPDTLKEMVYQFVDDNLELFNKDFVLFGHCTGILVAYETALYVREKLNKEPLCFIASGTESPKYSMTQSIILGDNGDCIISDEDLVQKMIEFELVAPSFADNKNFIQYYIPTYRNDLIMMSKYKYQETDKFNCPIYVMYGSNDKTIRDFAIHDWDNFTTNKVSYHEFNGGHFYLTDIKEIMAEQLTNYINESKDLKYSSNSQEVNYIDIVKNLFENILNVDDVQNDSSFFELGGNSLKASYLVAELLEKYNIELLISDIYEYETVEEIANFIVSSKND